MLIIENYHLFIFFFLNAKRDLHSRRFGTLVRYNLKPAEKQIKNLHNCFVIISNTRI